MTKNDDLPSYSPPELKTPEKTPEGFMIVAQNDMFPAVGGCFSAGCTTLFLAPFLIMFGGWFIYVISILTEIIQSPLTIELILSNLSSILIPCLFLILFSFLFFQSIYSNYRKVKQSAKFERPGEVILSKYPLHLGESCQVGYRRLLKTGMTLPETGHLKARLLCSEVVTYTVGTDETTVRKIMFEKSLANQTLYRGTRSIEFEETLEIPSNITPSFKAKNNQILWEIEVQLELPGLISPEKNPFSNFISQTLSTFAFVVDPEVVRS